MNFENVYAKNNLNILGISPILFEEADEIKIEGSNEVVGRAASMLKDIYRVEKGAKIIIKNDVSSKDACLLTLKGLNELWGLNRPEEKLVQLSKILVL